jgi:hypothetical protein
VFFGSGFLAVSFIIGALSVSLANDERAIFPTVSGHNLNGRAVQIPRDLSGRVNLIFVAFTREQQAEVNSWQPFVAEMTQRFPDVRAYELPTLAKPFVLLRGYLDGIMRTGIPDPGTRETTVTLFLDKSGFDRALGISSERAISVFLVAPGGEIVWRTTGPHDPAKSSELAKIIGADLSRER